MKLLILRPQPGASETEERARAIGLEPVVAPLFTIEGVDGPPVDAARYEAVLLTSANGARFAPSGLAALPCFAVGESTAAAARAAGFARVHTGSGDGAAVAAAMAAAGVRRAIHPCGRDHLAVEAEGVAIERHIVYSAEPVPHGRFDGPAVAMIHSARAGERFAELAGDRAMIAIAAISAAAADSAGEGWAAKAVAAAPRDQALLELAAKLCKYGFELVRDGNGL
ncbi:MAG: uroporphyrinogen-III synthase [Sphingomonadales bacterium]|nr:uroporphyrinogen-III synthase [Sphingomonadales bacterium]